MSVSVTVVTPGHSFCEEKKKKKRIILKLSCFILSCLFVLGISEHRRKVRINDLKYLLLSACSRGSYSLCHRLLSVEHPLILTSDPLMTNHPFVTILFLLICWISFFLSSQRHQGDFWGGSFASNILNAPPLRTLIWHLLNISVLSHTPESRS